MLRCFLLTKLIEQHPCTRLKLNWKCTEYISWNKPNPKQAFQSCKKISHAFNRLWKCVTETKKNWVMCKRLLGQKFRLSTRKFYCVNWMWRLNCRKKVQFMKKTPSSTISLFCTHPCQGLHVLHFYIVVASPYVFLIICVLPFSHAKWWWFGVNCVCIP